MTPILILILAQMCVAEIGWPESLAHLDECQAMWSINHERAQRWQNNPVYTWSGSTQVQDVTRLYNSFLKCEGRKCDTPRMKWVRHLNMYATQPEGWPGHKALWVNPRVKHDHRWVWLKTLQRATTWLATGRPWPRSFRSCRSRANQYGGAMDSPGECWVVLRCGETRQRYWQSRKCPPGPRALEGA